MSSATAQQAREKARQKREERVDEVARTLLQGEESDVDDPGLLEDAADRVEELEREERIEELQDRARAIVDEQVSEMQKATAAAGGLDQEIERLREALVQKLAARHEREEAYRDAKARAESIARVLDLGEVPGIQPPGEVPETDLRSRVEQRAESSGFNPKSFSVRADNLIFADGPEDGRRRLRRFCQAFDGEAAEIIQEYGELVLLPRKEETAERRRRKELEEEARAWVRELKRGNPPGTITDLPLPLQAALRSIRNEWRENYRIDEKAAARKIEAAVEESEVAVD